MIAAVLGIVAGLIHMGFFLVETVYWTRPAVWKTFGLRTQEDADAQAFALSNLGWYNLFLGWGAVVGSVEHVRNDASMLLVYCCLFMVAAGVVLVIKRPSMWRGAALQAMVPAFVVALLALS